MWSPGAHGMLPSGSCTDAIASTVCATCARGEDAGDLGELVISQGFASPISPSSAATFSPYSTTLLPSTGLSARSVTRAQRGLCSMSMAQEVVVAPDRRGVGVVEPVRALQPPVRRVERVRVVRAAQEEAGAFELQLELVLAVDAHVPAGRVVVVPVDRPRHALGPAGRNGRRDAAAGAQHARRSR